MKKTIITLSLMASVIGGLSSCYKDDSVDRTRAVSRISLADGAQAISDEYKQEFATNFQLTAPDVVQSNESLPLTYRWVVYPPTQTETESSRALPREIEGRNLDLRMEAYGRYDIFLYITNGDNTYTKRFRVAVTPPYSIGLYALLDKNGQPEIGYIPVAGYNSSDDAGTYKEGLALNNPITNIFRGFSAAPSSLATLQNLQDRYISLTLKDGNAYILNANTMQLVVRDPFQADPGEAKIISLNGVEMRGLIRNGQFYSYNTGSNSYIRQQRGQYTVIRRYPTTFFSDQSALCTTASGDAAVLYDTSNKVLYLMRTAAFTRIAMNSSLLASDENMTSWQNSKLVTMTSYGNRNQVALLLQSTTNATAHYLARFSFVGATSSEPIRYAGFLSVPASLGLNDASRLTSSGDIIYLSAGNQVYTYVSGSEIFASSPLVTLPAGEDIVQMLTRVENNQTLLYIATTDGTTSSIYCYDVTSGTSSTQLWAKRGISGKLLQLDYRAS